jgi:hypothetical protein
MSVVDKSPDAAKKSAETKAAAAAAAAKKKREEQEKHLADLKRFFGDVGLDNGALKVGTNQYGDLTLYKDIYEGTGKNREFVRRDEVFIWIQPNGLGFTEQYGSQVIKSVKTNFKGNLELLRKQLFDKDFLSENDYKTKNETAFNQAILNAARNHTLTQVQSYTIEGNTKFSPFKNWLNSLGSASKDEKESQSLYPLREINLTDRDVIEAIVRDAYRGTTDMSPDEADDFIQQKTNMYMDQIKEGTLTTMKKVGGVNVRQTTKGFTEAQVRAEIPGMIESELPGATKYKKNFDFLAFLDGMGAPVV